MKSVRKAVALLLILCLILPLLYSCGLEELIPSFSVVGEDGEREGDSYATAVELVRVSVADGEHFTVTSANPQDVTVGGSVSFNIAIDEGYEFDYSIGGAVFVESEASLEYDAGTLTLSDVRYPATIEIRVKKRTEPKNPALAEPCAHVGGTATCTERAVCDGCGEEYGSPLGHEYGEPMSYDGERHWYACKNEGCGETVGEFSHIGGTATCETLAECELCGASYGDLAEHNFSDDCVPSGDGHKRACTVCGEHSSVEAHYGGTADCVTLAECSACGEPWGEYAGHLWSEEPSSSDAGHWYECARVGCDAVGDVIPHLGGTATCVTLSECEVCLREYGSFADHFWSGELSSDGSAHWYGCENGGCAARTGVTAHSGGSASCTQLAKCDLCSTPYGSFAEHTVSSELSYNEYVHWYPCENTECDYMTGIEAHSGGSATTDEAAVCSVCGASYGEAIGPHDHIGGAATCDLPAVCILCGEGYGESLGHAWSEGYAYDSDSHWHYCENVGCTETRDAAAHWGGTATCQTQAVCTACGSPHGALGAHNWADTLTFDTDNHWHACRTAGCTEKNGVAAHSGGTATCQTLARCTACGTPHGALGAHDWADTLTFDTDNHWYACRTVGCTAKDGVTAHSGGTATCQTRAECTACGSPHGTLGAHDWADNLTFDTDNHWHACKTAGCTEKNGKEKHYGGEATNLVLAQCEACGKSYGELAEFRVVMLDAPEPDEGYKFICWTLDKPAKDGGVLLTDFESGSFTIPYESQPMANYVETGYHVILYRTNGGVTSDGKDFYYQTFSDAHFKMPNTLHQNGTFTREGYVLMRYTAEADGSGNFTTLGGKIMPNGRGFVELWCMWGKATVAGFKYSTYTNMYGKTATVITGYTGLSNNVVVPETLGGYPVCKIAAGAFSGSSITSLVLPASVETVEDGAFSNCKGLAEITFHDTIWNISDAAFSGCTNMKQYYLNAGMLPVHAGSGEGLFCLKYERLRVADARGEDVIIVVSGSSSLHGLSARQMQEAFNNEYTVVNYGTNAGANTLVYINAFINFLDEGDILIQAPETNQKNHQLGGTMIEWRTLRGSECMYEIFSYQDMSIYTNFFNSLSEFNRTQRSNNGLPKTGRSYESWANFLDEYTDIVNSGTGPAYDNTNPSGNPYNVANITEEGMARFNAIYARLNAKGVKMYVSFAPTDGDSYSAAVWDELVQLDFRDKLQSLLNYPVISHPGDYLLPHELMYDSIYHPSAEGRRVRTEQLIADLKAQLIAEGIWQE